MPHRGMQAGLRFALAFILTLPAFAGTFRIVTYNIEADINGFTTARPGMLTVLQGIGNEQLNGLARPIDILTLQETTSNSITVAPMVNDLNSLYGANTYAQSPYQGTQNGSNGSGNGPNAIIYNQTTLILVASVGVGTPSSSGAPRQPVRYEFRPLNGSAADDFYVYVSHMKSGTQSSDYNRRNIEAQMLRADELTLPAGSRVIYTGDLNLDGSSEAAYVTLTAAGNGQAFDPLNRPGAWASNSAFKDILTESATSLRYRDDFLLPTQNVITDPNGVIYVSGTYHTFGVNGTTNVGSSVNLGSNTALPGLPNRSAVLSALTTASDHLPVVGDFVFAPSQSPYFNGQPGTQSACAGDSVTISVVAGGTPTLTYQWRKGTTSLNDGGNLSGAQTATLTINPATTGDTASNYNCVVTNSFGNATSNNGTLTVNAPPTITGQPSNLSITIADPASFTVTPQGSTNSYTYQWRKDGTNLVDGGTHGGAHTNTFSLSSTVMLDAGSYDCVVTSISTGCDTISTTATLTLNQPACLGDLDGNNQVNLADLSIALSNYGLTPATYLQGDVDFSNKVDLSDLAILLGLYGTNCP